MVSRTGTVGLTLVLALHGGGSAFAQNAIPKLLPSCGGPFGLCGFIDRDTKAEVIPKRYEGAFRFSEGLAAVSAKGRFGYVDESGTEVISPQFELAGQFFLGLAQVMVGNNLLP